MTFDANKIKCILDKPDEIIIREAGGNRVIELKDFPYGEDAFIDIIKSVHEKFPYPIKRKSVKEQEKDIEEKFYNLLISQGFQVNRQVSCALGIADIVTQNEIFEVKVKLTLDAVRQAVAQLLTYQFYINRNAKLFIIGRKFSEDRSIIEYAEFHKVGIIEYDGKNFKSVK